MLALGEEKFAKLRQKVVDFWLDFDLDRLLVAVHCLWSTVYGWKVGY